MKIFSTSQFLYYQLTGINAMQTATVTVSVYLVGYPVTGIQERNFKLATTPHN
jgi:hypothetical protein